MDKKPEMLRFWVCQTIFLIDRTKGQPIQGFGKLTLWISKEIVGAGFTIFIVAGSLKIDAINFVLER